LTRKSFEKSTSLSSRLCVVLVNTRNPLNIGAAARAMSNFGFDDLRLVQPYEPSFREARSAVGASGILAAAREYKDVAEAVADCSLVIGTTAGARRELQHVLRPLDKAIPFIRRHASRGRVALLFGSEKRGLSNLDLSHCHWLLRIPTRPEHGSMNLGQAVAICLYETVRSTRQKTRDEGTLPARNSRERETKPATSAEVEMITALLLDSLRLSGYLEPKSPASSEERTRRMVRRLHLSSGDAHFWLGMLRQLVWKLNEGK
jgi:TrmH family RNA methyltransferase